MRLKNWVGLLEPLNFKWSHRGMKILTDMNYQRKQIYFSIFFLIFLFSENCAIRALGLGLLSSSSTIDQNGKKNSKKITTSHNEISALIFWEL